MQRDQYRSNRGIQTYRAQRAQGRAIAVACKRDPALGTAFAAARLHHPRDRAWEIALAAVACQSAVAESQSQYTTRDTYDRRVISGALVRARGNRSQTAADLGISPSTLRRRMIAMSMIRWAITQ